MAAECHRRFGLAFQRKLTLVFDGGDITSDAGLLLVREFDDRLGLTAALRTAVPDPRDRRYVSHDVLTLLRQRIYQIAAGYEDANDATYLRHDPTLQSLAHRLGVPLGSQPTLSRLENAVPWATIRRLGVLLRQWFTRHAIARADPPRELVLDIDSTDDPTHGRQALSFFNGHYDEHMFHPLLVFTDGYLLGARLRPGNVGGATHLRPLLEHSGGGYRHHPQGDRLHRPSTASYRPGGGARTREQRSSGCSGHHDQVVEEEWCAVWAVPSRGTQHGSRKLTCSSRLLISAMAERRAFLDSPPLIANMLTRRP